MNNLDLGRCHFTRCRRSPQSLRTRGRPHRMTRTGRRGRGPERHAKTPPQARGGSTSPPASSWRRWQWQSAGRGIDR
eukprot:15483666-Alexandrium_andersonii.AAC.1